MNGNLNKHNLIYCPEFIECPETTTPFYCKKIGGSLGYWNTPIGLEGSVKKGTYHFTRSKTGYALSPPYGECTYTHTDSTQKKPLVIYVNENYNSLIEAFYDEDTSWMIKEDTASCDSDSPSKCPLAPAPFLSVRNGQVLAFYISGVRIYSIGMPANPNLFHYLPLKEVLRVCGEVNECEIDILKNKTGTYYGSVMVNVQDNLKLIQPMAM
ncbi:hypothetical protein [Legionella sp.]|uniref:hypothetical protein n=1 Tax=Legionella sp. TaxID=459 RepID=UPI0039E6684A